MAHSHFILTCAPNTIADVFVFNRPPLVAAGVAPDPNHGLEAVVPASIAVAAGLGYGGTGNHTVSLAARPAHGDGGGAGGAGGSAGAGAATQLIQLGRQTFCFSKGRLLDKCGGTPVPTPWLCCREPPNSVPLQPAPPRPGNTYVQFKLRYMPLDLVTVYAISLKLCTPAEPPLP